MCGFHRTSHTATALLTRDDLDTHSLSEQGLPLHRPQYGDWDDTANRYS